VSLNWKEIDLVLAELPLVDSHIQQVIQPDFRTLLFQLYRPGNPFWMLICLETGKTRLHAWTGPVSKPRTRQRFAQMLHSRVKGGRIVAVEHVNHDRIVRMDVARAGEETTLWVRLWGGAANIIATDTSGVIIDAFFRRPKRGEVSGERFSPPEPKAHPSDDPRFAPRFEADDSSPMSVNAKTEAYYAELADAEERAALLATAARILRQRRNGLETQIARARELLQSAEPAERLQLYGDLIMANMHRLATGDRWLETEDYTNDYSPITIELVPSLSPGANAERCYERAKKSRRRQEALREEIRNLASRLEDTEARIERLDRTPAGELRDIIVDAGPAPQSQTRERPVTPGLRFASNGFTILVGRNARENDELLRRHVRGNDLWLHTRDFPGGYVFVRSRKGKSVPLEVLLDAGNLAVHFSRARTNGHADLYYAQVKHLRRAKDGPQGLVLPTHEKNLSITLDESRLSRLLA